MFQRAAAIAAVTGLLVLLTATAHGREVEINLHDDAAEVVLYFPAADQMYFEPADIGVGGFFNNQDDTVITGILHVMGPPAEGFSPLQFGAGGKGFIMYLDEPTANTVSALTLGLSARLTLPSHVPQALSARIHLAPSITSFGRAERVVEFVARYELHFTPLASAFLGYRSLRVDLEGEPNHTLDDSLHIGVRIAY